MRLHAFRQKIGRTTSVPSSPYRKTPGQSKVKTKVASKKFVPEVSYAYVMQYLKHRAATNQPVKIYYKDDKDFRTFYTCSFDETYLNVPSTKGYDYKYLIERIRNVEL